MRSYLFLILILLTLALPLGACSSPGSNLPMLPPAPSASAPYHLGPGDQLAIQVLGADELKGPYWVQDDGTISMLLIGKVHAAGLTSEELADAIAAKLKQGHYINRPQVSVAVLTYRPFYILGEVAKPGAYPYASGMRVLSAVAAAQGYTYRANQNYVIITRHGKEGKAVGLTPIRPDDIIDVPERYF
jgi:polysaccharide export outer membrane protein